jgi:importin-9
LKVLVEELHSASGSAQDLEAASKEALEDEESGEDEDWEDEPDILDFPGINKQGKFNLAQIPETGLETNIMNLDLQAYGEEGPGPRVRDDETQAYLMNFFRQASQKPGFDDMFNALLPEEQAKLRSG